MCVLFLEINKVFFYHETNYCGYNNQRLDIFTFGLHNIMWNIFLFNDRKLNKFSIFIFLF